MQYSVVKFDKLENSAFRLDAEYYKPEYLKEDNQRFKYQNITLGQIAFITDGQHGYHEVDNSSPIFHLTAKNAKIWFANTIGADKIAKWVDEKNKRSSLKVNDLILSTRGTIGFCAIVNEDVLPANIDQDVARIALNKNMLIPPEYLLAYLNSNFGYDWLIRNSSGMVQQGLSLEKVRQIPIPLLSESIQTVIKQTIGQAYRFYTASQSYHTQAEHILLSELGLTHWQPKHQLSFVKNFSDTHQTERIDAEYFQPKHDEIVDAIRIYKGGWDTLGNLVNIKDKNFSPEHDVVYKYIELSNIGPNGEVTDYTEGIGGELPTRARRIVFTEDVIVSSIEGSLSSIALITEEHINTLCSTGFYVINSESYNSETLLCLLKSIVGQVQLKKGCTGTILTAINKDEFSRIVLPNMSDQIQETIKDNISSAYESKTKSKQLLEIAKQGVELAIEQDEKTAEEWIKMQVDNLDINLKDEE